MQGVAEAVSPQHVRWGIRGGVVAMVIAIAAGRIAGPGSLVTSAFGLVFWAGLAATCCGVLLRRAQAHAAQTRGAQQWASENGWSYTQRDDSVLVGLTGNPFVGGRGGAMAVDVLRGVHPVHDTGPGVAQQQGETALEAVSYVYRYVVRESLLGLVKSYADVYVTAVRLPAVLPRIEVGPEGASGPVRPLGATDHLIESAEFNDTYVVLTDDPRGAHDVLHARLAQRLLEPDLVGQSWVVENGWIRTWDALRPQTAAVVLHLHLLETIVGLVPRHVWQDARTDASHA